MSFLSSRLLSLLNKQTPATALGLFRILYGLVTLQEILFLNYFSHLIFDPVPYIDVEFPTIPFFLCLWGGVTCCLTVGYRYQFSAISNYLFWLVFVNFTSMQRDFAGGFDLFMTGAGFFLLFLPADRAFSIDHLRRKLSNPFKHYREYTEPTVTVLAYYLPIAICLGFVYFDSAIHKLFSEHWRNGLGSWLPSTQPYYVSALDMSAFLNQEWLQKALGYTILVFQLTFIFLFASRRLRWVYVLIGAGLHLGITLCLNIYPFGLGMLIFYTLLVPFSWWRSLASWLTATQPYLTVFYDQFCPLCNRTALIINHFDIFKRVDFKSAQDYAKDYPAIAALGQDTLLTDLYALDPEGEIYSGVDSYRQIFLKMGYLAPLGILLGLPGIYQWAKKRYRAIADSRGRVTCTTDCVVSKPITNDTWYQSLFVELAGQNPKAFSRKLAKILLAIFILQVNCTLHYGLLYRFGINTRQNAFTSALADASNALISVSQIFLGIAPHALYLHDHFAGYDRILAITYLDSKGVEQWLPFINQQGRLLAPNWGRVQMMWANIAVTPNIDNTRLRKFLLKVTAFWGQKIGIDLNNAVFYIKMKKISAPNEWVYDQLHLNFNAPWQPIGKVIWSGQDISYDLPLDINAL